MCVREVLNTLKIAEFLCGLPATSPLYEILMDQHAQKTPSSFFTNAAAARRLLFKQEPSHMPFLHTCLPGHRKLRT